MILVAVLDLSLLGAVGVVFATILAAPAVAIVDAPPPGRRPRGSEVTAVGRW